MGFFDSEQQAPYKASQPQDSTTFVTLVVNGYTVKTKDYMYISDVLNLGDPFSCTVPNPDGQYSSLITPGAKVDVYMSDASVSGGSNVLFFTGIVVSRDFSSDMQGSVMHISCADLGWHLQNNTAPVWLNLRGLQWDVLLQKLIDPSWGIKGTFLGILNKNKRVRTGRAGIKLELTPQVEPDVLPRLQVEPGETCADILIKYAKLSKLLVNMTGDGYLQLFSPVYNGPRFYTFEYHKSTEKGRSKNNIQSVSINDSIDGVYTDVSCYSVTMMPFVAASNNPNEGHFKGLYHQGSNLPFVHRLSFSDAEQLNRKQATARSAWKAARGMFDSWKYEVEVYGHQQNGSFYTPDTMCAINDTVHGISGNYYVQAVKYERNEHSGTKTTLTIRKPNLLAA